MAKRLVKLPAQPTLRPIIRRKTLVRLRAQPVLRLLDRER